MSNWNYSTFLEYKNYKFWLDYSYSNYREHINQHIQQTNQDEISDFYGDIAFDYYRGHNIFLSCEYAKSERRILSNILPRKGFYRKIKLICRKKLLMYYVNYLMLML